MGTYSDHGEKDDNRPKNSLGRRDAGDLIGEVQGFDGHIQRRKGTAVPFRSLRLCVHRGKSWYLQEKSAVNRR